MPASAAPAAVEAANAGGGAATVAADAASGSPSAAAEAAGTSKGRVFLRLEYISDGTTRRVLLLQKLAGVAAWGLLIWELFAQVHRDSNSLLRSNALEIVNISVGFVCLAAMACVDVWMARRVWGAARHVRAGASLSRRKRLLLGLGCAELAVHTANLCCYFAANIYSLSVYCGWFHVTVHVLTLLSLSFWNTLFILNIARPFVLLPPGAWQRLHDRCQDHGGLARRLAACCCCCFAGSNRRGGRPASTSHGAHKAAADGSGSEQEQQQQPQAAPSFDRSMSVLPPTREDAAMARWVVGAAGALLWLPAEVMLLAAVLSGENSNGVDNVEAAPDGTLTPLADLQDADWTDCRQWPWNCSTNKAFTVLSVTVGTLFLADLLVFIALFVFVLSELKRLPYTPYRVMNVAARLQLRTRMSSNLFFIVCLVLLFYTNISSCNENVQLSLGLGPMMVSMTCLLAAESVLYSPAPPTKCALRRHSQLQRFAWAEAEAPAVAAARALPGEPLFCFETCLKACYLCLHSYRHFRPESTISSLQTAMALYGCTHHEWLREPRHDMNCLLAWGPHALVIAFRGTQSLANVKADAKFWRSPHPPQRRRLLHTRPLVHTGFLKSWLEFGLNEQVMLRVRQVLQGSEHAGGMPPFPSTVVRCCSDAHAERGAEVLAAAAAAREAEATGDGLCGEEGSGLDEDAIDAALAEAPSGSGSLGSGGSQPPSAAASGLDSSASGSSAGSGGGDAAAAAPASKQQQQPFRILVTGHSLGGSVATLCAYDLAHALPGWGSAVAAAPVAAGEGAGTAAAAAGAAATPAGAAGSAAEQAEGRQRPQQRPVLLSCYTFGAPRTGNHSFARAYGAAVPDSWAVVNDQDMVAKSAKFVVLFKRCGHVALVNPRGDLIVNPSFLEHNVQRTMRASVKQHLLLSYNASFAAILRSQHAGKGLRGGETAVALLAANPAVRELLLRPLAIRQASLRRYIAGSRHTSVTAPTVVVAGSGGGPTEGDLSGDAVAADVAGEEADSSEEGGGVPRTLHRMLSTFTSAALDSLKV